MKQLLRKKWIFLLQHLTDCLNGYSKPSVNTALKLSQFIPELKKSLPEEVLQMLKTTMNEEDFKSMGKALATFLSEKHFFLCWILAFSNKGITEEEIEDQFGKQGIRALKTLEQKWSSSTGGR